MGKRVELKVVTDFTDAEALKKNLVFVQDDTVPEPNDGEVLSNYKIFEMLFCCTLSLQYMKAFRCIEDTN